MNSLQDSIRPQRLGEAGIHRENRTIETENSILIALDGSPASQAAARVAVQIAGGQHLSAYGIYVADLMTLLGGNFGDYHAELGNFWEPHSEPEAIELFERHGRMALRSLKEICLHEKVPVQTDIIFGGVPEQILSRAEHVRLVSLGRRGFRHASEPQHLGSNFRYIVHHVHRPIITAGDFALPIHHILLACNGNRRADDLLSWASHLQHATGCKITALNVSENGDLPASNQLSILDHLDQHGLIYDRLVIRTGEPADEIVAVAEEFEVQLILMGGYQHGALLESLLGSTIDTVLRHTPLPVFIAQRKRSRLIQPGCQPA